MMRSLTIEQVRSAMEQADESLSDGAYWGMVCDICGSDHGEVMEVLAEAKEKEDPS